MVKVINILLFIFFIKISLAGTIKEQKFYVIPQSKDSSELIFAADFNHDGQTEILIGRLMKRINKNTFWIKNARILNSAQTLIVNFGKQLSLRNRSIVNFGPAYFGYIVEIYRDEDTGKMYIGISIADPNGEKGSGELFIGFSK